MTWILGLVLSSPARRQMVLAGGAVLLVLGFGWWLRHDAALDERARASAAADRSTVEALVEKNLIEEEVRNEPDSDLRDFLGIPVGVH